jgi:hypothetical protein
LIVDGNQNKEQQAQGCSGQQGVAENTSHPQTSLTRKRV